MRAQAQQETTYTVSTWDHEADDWCAEKTGLTKWQIRTALRELYCYGWTPISIQVKAETHDRPAARWSRPFINSNSTKLPKSVRRRLQAALGTEATA